MNDLAVAPSLEEAPSEVTLVETVGFGRRAAARLLDTLFTFGFSLFAGVLAGIVLVVLASMGKAPADWLARAQDTGWTAYLWGLLASTLYHATSEAIGGASLGKLILGLRVLSQDFTPCTVRGALVRSLGFLVDGLFFGFVGYSSMSDSRLQQRFGDKWGRTVVVRASTLPAASRRGAGPVVLGLFGGVAAAVCCYAASMLIAGLG